MEQCIHMLERSGGRLALSLRQYGGIDPVLSGALSIIRGGNFPLVEFDSSKTSDDEPLFPMFNLPRFAFGNAEDNIGIHTSTAGVGGEESGEGIGGWRSMRHRVRRRG